MESLDALLFAGLAACLVALAVAVSARRRARRVLGPLLSASRPARWGRALLALAAIALGVGVALGGPDGRIPALALAAASAALAWATPARAERRCGERGVVSGWEVYAFEDLAEWRLTGDHLRFRGAGEWTAVDAPSALHPKLRALLEARCAARESRFNA